LRSKVDFIGGEAIGAVYQPSRLATVVAILPCMILRIDNKEMVRALDADKSLALFSVLSSVPLYVDAGRFD